MRLLTNVARAALVFSLTLLTLASSAGALDVGSPVKDFTLQDYR